MTEWWDTPRRWTLRVGDIGPVHQGPGPSGAAALTVARMLAHPAFARWITTGLDPRLPIVDTQGPQERFAAYERLVLRRTNGWRAAGSVPNLPWPARAGTSPFGARWELENGAARRGASYRLESLARVSDERLRESLQHLQETVAAGVPALLYVGDRRLPRSCALVIDAPGGGALTIYDPADGSVGIRTARHWMTGSLGLGGWDRPWLVLAPRTAPARVVQLRRWLVERPPVAARLDQPLGTGTGSTSRTSSV